MPIPVLRRYKGDRLVQLYGGVIPLGSTVKVLRFFPRRRVLVDAGQGPVLTMLWCLVK